MKKTLSIVLALTMLFALCVPSFAANKTITETSDPKTGNTVIKTNNSAAVAAGGVFTVEFPATAEIVWNTLSTPLECEVFTNLVNDKQLTVTAKKKTNLVNAGDTLVYTIGETNKEVVQTGLKTTVWNPTVEISVANWKKAPVAKTYTGEVTFEATVGDSSTP